MNTALNTFDTSTFANLDIAKATSSNPNLSSINLTRSIKYGIGVLGVSFKYWFKRLTN